MSRLIDIDDDRNCYIGMDGEYETWNISPNVLEEVRIEQKWIPCSERLPEDEQLILVTYKTTDRIHICRFHADGSSRQWYSLNDMVRAYNNVVLAWMPLPEPFREEGEQSRSDQDREDMIRRIISICDEARRRYKASVYHNCNNCGRKECQFARWNCPLWEEGEEPEADRQGV